MAKQERAAAPKYNILQIIPAAPGTFALHEMEGDLVRVPVPAWGLWDVTYGDDEPIRTGGPLVLDTVGCLEPAPDTGSYCGVRIGDCVMTRGATVFDDPKA